MTQPRAKNGRYRKAEPGERYAAQFRLIHGEPPDTDAPTEQFPILHFLWALATVTLIAAMVAG